jgi:hypothetical protein
MRTMQGVIFGAANLRRMRETFFFGARRPHQQVLLLVGLTLLGLILFSVLGLLIAKKLFGLAWEGGQLPQAGTPGLLGGLRTLQFFQSVGTFVLPSVAFFWVQRWNWRLDVGWTSPPVSRHWLWAGCMAWVVLPMVNASGALNALVPLPTSALEAEASARALTEAFLSDASFAGLGVNLLVMAVLPALGEELLFRGALQPLLLRWTARPHLSIWVTALLFSALHMQFAGFLPRLLLGALLGYAGWLGKSIWLPMLIHGLNNATAVLIGWLQVRGWAPKGMEEVGAAPEQWPWVLASFLVFLGLSKWALAGKAGLTSD